MGKQCTLDIGKQSVGIWETRNTYFLFTSHTPEPEEPSDLNRHETRPGALRRAEVIRHPPIRDVAAVALADPSAETQVAPFLFQIALPFWRTLRRSRAFALTQRACHHRIAPATGRGICTLARALEPREGTRQKHRRREGHRVRARDE